MLLESSHLHYLRALNTSIQYMSGSLFNSLVFPILYIWEQIDKRIQLSHLEDVLHLGP